LIFVDRNSHFRNRYFDTKYNFFQFCDIFLRRETPVEKMLGKNLFCP